MHKAQNLGFKAENKNTVAAHNKVISVANIGLQHFFNCRL